jgi:hypothetical protein
MFTLKGRVLPWLMISCGLILMSIWPMLHTMALRNLLLFTGGLLGLLYIIQERQNFYQRSALPFFLILLFFIWLGAHYLLFSRSPELEFANIKGTWLRTLLACFLGAGIGLFVRNQLRTQQIIWLSIFFFLFNFYGNYVWIALSTGSWAIPIQFHLVAAGVYNHKIHIVYFGLILLSLICALISYYFTVNAQVNRRLAISALIVIGLTFFTFIIASSKNGVALGLVIILALFVSFIRHIKISFSTILLLVAGLFIIGFMTALHLKFNPEWNNFIPAVQVGIQIDKYPNWRDDNTYPLPKAQDGAELPLSAYLRTAYVIAGIKLLFENPLGYGLTDQSFRHLLMQKLGKAPLAYFSIYGTHSGWLDFALGVGIPGLILIWSAITAAILLSLKHMSAWSYATRWIIAGLTLIWMFVEVDSSHFIETMFYLISLLAAGNIPILTRSKDLTHTINAQS